MPIYITDSSPLPAFNGQVSSTMGPFTSSMAGSSDTQPDFDGSLNRAMGSFTASFGDTRWPANSWFLIGGYMISDAPVQLVVEPEKTYNAEKDILIAQLRAPDRVTEEFLGYYKGIKEYNPNCKILAYCSPSEVRKAEFYANGTTNPDFTYRLISGSDGLNQWYLRNADGDQVQAKFSFQYTRANMCLQFLNNNSSGLNYGEQFFSDWFVEATTTYSEGRFIDYIDGIYIDVLPPAPQNVYVYDSNPQVGTSHDFNNDGSSDSDSDESANGGVTMHRTGVVSWVAAFKNIFGPNLAVWRNGSRDGNEYSTSGELAASTKPMEQSEFYQAWDGNIFENMQNGISLRKNTSTLEYDITLEQFEFMCTFIARQKASLKPEGTHLWGRFGSHAVVLECKLHDRDDVGGAWRTKDYNAARWATAIARLNGVAIGLSVTNAKSFPSLDEDVIACGDTLDGSPPTMGTYDPSTAVNGTDADYTLRSPDYTIGGAEFHWQQYYTADGANRLIWVARTDYDAGEVHGYGTAVACQLPNPGSGKKWAHIDVTGTITNGIRQTREQDTSLNGGQDVPAGIDPWGQVDLKPAHAVLLISKDS